MSCFPTGYTEVGSSGPFFAVLTALPVTLAVGTPSRGSVAYLEFGHGNGRKGPDKEVVADGPHLPEVVVSGHGGRPPTTPTTSPRVDGVPQGTDTPSDSYAPHVPHQTNVRGLRITHWTETPLVYSSTSTTPRSLSVRPGTQD